MVLIGIAVTASLAAMYFHRKRHSRLALGFGVIMCFAIVAHQAMKVSPSAKDTTATFVFGGVGLLLVIALIILSFRRK